MNNRWSQNLGRNLDRVASEILHECRLDAVFSLLKPHFEAVLERAVARGILERRTELP